MSNNDTLLKMTNITKMFPGVIACNDISIDVNKSEIHAIVGENGAGKSTLIKILSGSESQNSGEIYFDGILRQNYSPAEAIKMGISVIYQEFNLFPSLSIYENIFFGKEISRNGIINIKEMILQTKELFLQLGMDIDPKRLVKYLSIAEQQMTEIVRAVSNKAKLIVMDEPTATLSNREISQLFTLIKALKASGTSVVYISHRLEEIFEIADRVTVMRDGRHIISADVCDMNKDELVKNMVGRELSSELPYSEVDCKEIILEVKNICSDRLRNVSFFLKSGEVLGISGLVGAGRTELARALFGADNYVGDIFVKGKLVKIRSPKDAIAAGIVLLPEDRKKQGLILGKSVKFNITFGILNSLSKWGLIIFNNKETKLVEEYIKLLKIKTPSLDQNVANLSGGNQQKVVVAKWLATNSEIIIFDEPTRGIDVGAKKEIYNLINDLKNDGKSIIMISSELPEIIGMCDRVLIMYNGKVAGEIFRGEMSQETILKIESGEIVS